MNITQLVPGILKESMTIPSSGGLSEAGPKGGSSFASFLEKSIGDVNELLKAADTKSTDLAVGRTENLHGAMIAMEKAETAFKLMMQVRNKAIEAYHEIMRMQV